MPKISMEAARVNANLTQDQMAEKLGVTRQTYATWEKGKAEMRPAYFIAFCRITGVPEDAISLPKDLP